MTITLSSWPGLALAGLVILAASQVGAEAGPHPYGVDLRHPHEPGTAARSDPAARLADNRPWERRDRIPGGFNQYLEVPQLAPSDGRAPGSYGVAPRLGGGQCSYWHRRCDTRWGYGTPSYRGCMVYEGC